MRNATSSYVCATFAAAPPAPVSTAHIVRPCPAVSRPHHRVANDFCPPCRAPGGTFSRAAGAPPRPTADWSSTGLRRSPCESIYISRDCCSFLLFLSPSLPLSFSFLLRLPRPLVATRTSASAPGLKPARRAIKHPEIFTPVERIPDDVLSSVRRAAPRIHPHRL